MKLYTSKQLHGKFLAVYDSIIDGHQCMMGGEEGEADYAPLLFNSAEEAFIEIFEGNHCMLESHMESGQLEEYNDGVTPAMVIEMGEILQSGDVVSMRKFMEEHPECNDSGDWVEPAETFIMNRKFIFSVNGSIVTGKKLSEL